MKLVFNDNEIVFDVVKPNSDNNTVLLFKNKNDLDYIPPIIVDSNCLSDFGKLLFAER